MKSSGALLIARFWALFSGGHLLAMLALGYATDRVGASLKAAPSEVGRDVFRSLDGVAEVLSWPLDVFVGAAASAPVVLGAILLHSLCWGAVWLVLFKWLRGLKVRKTHEG